MKLHFTPWQIIYCNPVGELRFTLMMWTDELPDEQNIAEIIYKELVNNNVITPSEQNEEEKDFISKLSLAGYTIKQTSRITAPE